MVEVRDRNHTDRVHNEAMREKEENDNNNNDDDDNNSTSRRLLLMSAKILMLNLSKTSIPKA